MGAKNLQGSAGSLHFKKISKYQLETKCSANLRIIIGANHRYSNHQNGFHIIERVTKRVISLPGVTQNCMCWEAYWFGTGGWRIYLQPFTKH